MGFEITAFRVVRLKAEHKQGGTSNWVEITCIEPDRAESSITLFFEGPGADRKAAAYAGAINFADATFHPLEIARELAEEVA